MTPSSPDDFLIARFTRELVRLRRSQRTIRSRTQILSLWRRFLTERGLTLLEATRDDVLDFLCGYDEPETIGTYQGGLSVFYTWAVDEGLIPREPTRRLPKVIRDECNPNPIPNDVLRDVLIQASPVDQRIIILGRFAGMRASEIAATHRTYLRRGRRGDVVRFRGKGNRWRELPAHPLVARTIRQETGYLFESPRFPGQPMQPETIGQRMSRLLPHDYTCHDLRAAFATAAYWQNGRDLTLVQGWLGHASPKTTLRYVAIEHDWKAMEAMTLDGEWGAA